MIDGTSRLHFVQFLSVALCHFVLSVFLLFRFQAPFYLGLSFWGFFISLLHPFRNVIQCSSSVSISIHVRLVDWLEGRDHERHGQRNGEIGKSGEMVLNRAFADEREAK
jgi:hypothetical protein